MNALQRVFSSSAYLLCQWHVNKNIKAWARKYFAQAPQPQQVQGTPLNELNNTPLPAENVASFCEAWRSVTKSRTSPEFRSKLCQLKQKYRSHRGLLKYLDETWLPWKKRFADAWVDQHFHLGAVVTLRAEGAHSALKRLPEVRTCALFFMNTADKISTGSALGRFVYGLSQHLYPDEAPKPGAPYRNCQGAERSFTYPIYRSLRNCSVKLLMWL